MGELTMSHLAYELVAIDVEWVVTNALLSEEVWKTV